MSTPIKKIPLTHIEDLSIDGFIPLTGTEEGKPVTGDIVVSFENDSESNYGGLGMSTIGDTPSLKSYRYGNKNVVPFEVNTQGFINREFGEDGQVTTNRLTYSGNTLSSNNYEEPTSEEDFTQKKYVDRANSYSTTEIKTGGTWIDGKPIYRKVIEIDTFNSGLSVLTHNLGISEYIVKKFKGYWSSGDTEPDIDINTSQVTIDINTNKSMDETVSSSSFGEVSTGTNSLNIEAIDNGLELLGQIILEYTKTTP